MYGALYQVETGTYGADVTLSEQSWTVMGTVMDQDTLKPLTRYTLAIEGDLKDPNAGSYVKQETLNTPDGTYQLTFHEPGVYYIHFSVDGYQPPAIFSGNARDVGCGIDFARRSYDDHQIGLTRPSICRSKIRLRHRVTEIDDALYQMLAAESGRPGDHCN